MSRYADDRYDDRRTNVSRRRYDDDEFEVRSRYDGPAPSRRPPAETMVRERDADTVISQGRRTERPAPRQPDFLREDYGRNPNAGPLVVREERREERREDDYVSRAPTWRRSLESVRSRGPPGPPERVEKAEFTFRERDGESRGPPYPRSERGGYDEQEEISFKETRSRAPPSTRGGGGHEERTEIRFKEDDRTEWMPPRREYRDREVEEIKFRRGGGDRPSPPPPAPAAPPPRTEVDREEITFTRRESSRERSRAPPPRHEEREEITFTHRERSRERSRVPPPRSTYDREEIEFRERRSSPPQQQYRGREDRRDVDIDIDIDINRNERSAPPPRARSQSRGQLVGRKHEEWIVRRERTPTPPPPQKDFEREEIIIRTRKERTPSPEPPPREPTPEPTPPPPPPAEPIYRPPIIQEVITHHRTIDHGVERARSPTPPPPPAPLPPPPETKEEDLQIEIKRSGTRNGKAYEEDIQFELDRKERDGRDSRQRSRSAGPRRARSFSKERVDNRELAIRSRSRYDDRVSSRYDDEVAAEADYYNRKVSSRGYPGEAYDGATKDWGLVDIPPGTSRVAMDGVGGGRQELTWDRYAGDRHGKFYTGDRVYEQDWGRERNGYAPPAPAPLPPPERQRERDDVHIDIKINEDTRSGKTKDKMWTEITKDLVIKEAIEERGYEYEETDEFFYVMVYLRYEDVLRLVETTEDIRRQRRERIREIQWERDEMDRRPAQKALPAPPMIPPPPIREARGGYDERIVEREYYHDRQGRGGYR